MWSLVRTESVEGIETEYYAGQGPALLVGISTLLWFGFCKCVAYEKIIKPFVPRDVTNYFENRLKHARGVVADAKVSSNRGDGMSAISQKTLDEADAFLLDVQYRTAGFFHAITVLPLCVWLYVDPKLRSDPLLLTSVSWHVTGPITVGYFVWDIMTVLMTWGNGSWQWLLHALVSLCSLGTPFAASYGPMSYFAAGFLFHELSTPFLNLRWFCLEAGLSSSVYCKVLEVLFGFSFFFVRIVWGPIWFYPSVYQILFSPSGQLIWAPRRWTYYVAMPAFFLLNIYWFSRAVRSAIRGSRKKQR